MSRIATVNFDEMVHNDTFLTKRFNFFASDGTTPMDLTDATPEIKIRLANPNGKLVRTCTVGDGLSWENQAQGQLNWGGFVMSWPKAAEYHYDLQLTYATSGNIRTYVKGIINLIDDVT